MDVGALLVFTHLPSFSDLTLSMPSKPAAGAKKRPVAKTLALKDAMAKTSAQKAASRNHATQGKEHHLILSVLCVHNPLKSTLVK